MKRAAIIIIIAAVAILGAFAFQWTRSADAQGDKGKWKLTDVGEIPTEFGDMVAVIGLPPNWGLVFKNSENEIYLVELKGNRVPGTAKKIVRK